MKYILFFLCLPLYALAQISPIDFEPNGNGANWTWTPFENDSNPAVLVVPNPSTSGINSSANVISSTSLMAGQPWAGFESMHGADIGTFSIHADNAVIKMMVYKSVISDVGLKFATAAGASTGELKVANTLINTWEELTFDFSSQIGHPATTDVDQIIIFPDFQARTSDNISYFDNISFGPATVNEDVEITFNVQFTAGTPVYVFGSWNNWSDFPGTEMTSLGNSIYSTTMTMPGNQSIEFKFVVDTTLETLDPNWPCTNGNAMYTNRILELEDTDIDYCSIWATCDACFSAITENQLDNIQLILNSTGLQILSDDHQFFDQLLLFDLSGKQLLNTTNVPTNKIIPLELNQHQIYFIQLKKGQKQFTQKIHFTE